MSSLTADEATESADQVTAALSYAQTGVDGDYILLERNEHHEETTLSHSGYCITHNAPVLCRWSLLARLAPDLFSVFFTGESARIRYHIADRSL